MSKFRTVDADGHVEEAHVNWADRIAEPYRKMAPQPRPATDSHLRLVMEGKPWPIPSGSGVGIGGPYSRPHPRRDGMKDPNCRLADMDSEGIDLAVLFGGGIAGTIPALENAGFAIALARARNDWLARILRGEPFPFKRRCRPSPTGCRRIRCRTKAQRERVGICRRVPAAQPARASLGRSLLLS